ncbi:MAG: tripartite tricarboxylate transporter substrate binding protein [Pseudorhodoferax sp.]
MFTRRALSRAALAAAAFTAVATATLPARAGDYPDRAIKMVVGFPAGQSSDTTARRIAQSMTATLRQSVYVDNRPGAAGIISHEAVKNAAPDGYTLLMASTGTLAINPALYRKMPYDPLKDFEPIALVSASPLVLFTSAASPLNSMKDLSRLAHARPGKVTYGSSGSGTTGHIAMEMLKKEAGIDLLHVPYKGSPPMLTDVISGQVDVAFDTAGSVLPMVKTGRVKILGVASAAPMPMEPEIPTLASQGLAGFQAVPWAAILAPKGTPAAIVARLNEAVNAALKDPAVLEQFRTTGSQALGGTPQELAQYLHKEHALWGKAVAASGAQVD